tara:strand:- start:457 stop:975 length:519 start_codon:yes stop_codon:yes gene_type:complete
MGHSVLPLRKAAGKWLLPQPKDAAATGEYVPIPVTVTLVKPPFGYKFSEESKLLLIPIPHELEALEKAKKYLKQYASRNVAAWLTKVTGRYISHVGLLHRVKNERQRSAKVSILRSWARRYKKALELAEKYEDKKGTKVYNIAKEIVESARHLDPDLKSGTGRDSTKTKGTD